MNREEATIEVPTKGGGPPEESKEPQLPVGPNPELVGDEHEGMVSFLFWKATFCTCFFNKGHRNCPCAFISCISSDRPQFFAVIWSL